MDAETVRQLKIRNADGDMVPLGAVADVRVFTGLVQVNRYNMFPAAAITGASLPGVSTGDVLAVGEVQHGSFAIGSSRCSSKSLVPAAPLTFAD